MGKRGDDGRSRGFVYGADTASSRQRQGVIAKKEKQSRVLEKKRMWSGILARNKADAQYK